MIKKSDIVDIVEECKGKGVGVRVRDIAFAVLGKVFDDKKMAYQCLFGDEGCSEYLESKDRGVIEECMESKGIFRSEVVSDGTDLTFEENRKEMVKMIAETQKNMDDGLIEPKDGLKIIADIRVKLNDKFNVKDEGGDRVIIVNRKYNDICQHCGREISVPTKEEMMDMYGLIEKR